MTPLADEVDTNIYDIKGEEGEHEPWSHSSRVRTAAGVAAAVVIGALAFAGIAQTSALAVNQIDVTGNNHLNPADITKWSGVKVGKSIVTLNTGSAEGKLEKQPWIDDATVDRNWPHGVHISVKERRPVAQTQTGDKKWAQIGEGGIVLSIVDGPTPGLPVPLGTTAPSQPGAIMDASAKNLLDIATALPASLQSQVTQIQEDSGQYRLGLSAGTIVELGDLRDLGDKLMAAAAVLSNTEAKTLATLDVRSPHLPIATPKNATTTTAAPAAKPTGSTTTTAKPKTSSTTTAVKRSTTTVAR